MSIGKFDNLKFVQNIKLLLKLCKFQIDQSHRECLSSPSNLAQSQSNREQSESHKNSLFDKNLDVESFLRKYINLDFMEEEDVDNKHLAEVREEYKCLITYLCSQVIVAQ